MKKQTCIVFQIILLVWFFLDMIGVYFGDSYLVTRSYQDEGAFFLIYLATVLLFIFKEKIGKWAVAVFSSIWFITQFLSHEWYTIFGAGVMGTVEGKIKYFSNALKWLEIDGRYIPDVYHTVLHLLILTVLITTTVYICNSRKRKADKQ